MDQLSLGVMARSRKESERRLAIHPLHIERIDAGLRRRIYLEHGYGERFGVPDERLAAQVAGVRHPCSGSSRTAASSYSPQAAFL